MCFISIYSVTNTLSELLTFTYQKSLLDTHFCLFLKSWKAFSVSWSYPVYLRHNNYNKNIFPNKCTFYHIVYSLDLHNRLSFPKVFIWFCVLKLTYSKIMFTFPSESIEINWNLSQNWIRCGDALIFFWT